jgi:glutamate synthase (NADPH/NADH) large chain
MIELEGLTSDDATFLATLLEEHVEETGSVKAAELLNNWEQTLARFVKVVPTEYRRVLEAQKKKQAEALVKRALPVVEASSSIADEPRASAEAE